MTKLDEFDDVPIDVETLPTGHLSESSDDKIPNNVRIISDENPLWKLFYGVRSIIVIIVAILLIIGVFGFAIYFVDIITDFSQLPIHKTRIVYVNGNNIIIKDSCQQHNLTVLYKPENSLYPITPFFGILVKDSDITSFKKDITIFPYVKDSLYYTHHSCWLDKDRYTCTKQNILFFRKVYFGCASNEDSFSYLPLMYNGNKI